MNSPEALREETDASKVLEQDASRFGVYIAVSTVPKYGNGLFARRQFQPGDILGFYWGNILSREEVQQRYPDDALDMWADRVVEMTTLQDTSNQEVDYLIDASKSCAASYANHSDDPEEQNARIIERLELNSSRKGCLCMIQDNPAEFAKREDLVVLEALKPIAPGTEIWVDYGENFYLGGPELTESQNQQEGIPAVSAGETTTQAANVTSQEAEADNEVLLLGVDFDLE